MKFLVISTSMSSTSRSRVLAQSAYERLPEAHQSGWLDLQTEGLPLCDGGPAADDRVDRLRREIRGSGRRPWILAFRGQPDHTNASGFWSGGLS